MNPVIPFLIVLIILFVLWLFWGGRDYEYLGFKPLDPTTRSHYLLGEPEVCHVEEEEDVCHMEEPRISVYEPPENPEVCLLPTEPRQVDTTPPLPPRFDNGNQTIGGRKGRESLGQKQTCEALERIYGRPFIRNVRPNFLRNPETGANLEYDCYNPELRIAAEYNGPQHYKWPNYLGSRQTYEQFIQQVRRDKLKVELSDRNGVYLITVPYNVPTEKIEEYIRYYLPEEVQKRRQMGLEIP